MAVGTKPAELRELAEESLEDRLREAKEELFNLRFQAATGQLESHGRLRAVRRDIARIYTIMRERELGITTVIDYDTIDDAIDEAPADETDDVEDDDDVTEDGAEK